MAEELFVINPIWKIEETTWMDICYARLTGKDVSSLESLSYREIQDKENDFLFQAEGLVQKQLEMAQHNDYLDKRDFVSFSLQRSYHLRSMDPGRYAGRAVCLEPA